MEFVTITIPVQDLQFLLDNDLLPNVQYKAVEVKDDFFKDDKIHEQLKAISTKAYKQLKEYEFKKRNP